MTPFSSMASRSSELVPGSQPATRMKRFHETTSSEGRLARSATRITARVPSLQLTHNQWAERSRPQEQSGWLRRVGRRGVGADPDVDSSRPGLELIRAPDRVLFIAKL